VVQTLLDYTQVVVHGMRESEFTGTVLFPDMSLADASECARESE